MANKLTKAGKTQIDIGSKFLSLAPSHSHQYIYKCANCTSKLLVGHAHSHFHASFYQLIEMPGLD